MQPLELRTTDHRIRPVRGLVLTRNVQGAPFDLVDLRTWLRLNHDVFKTEKIDVFLNCTGRDILPALLEQAATLDTRLSLRTDCPAAPPALENLGLLDVFLTPRAWDVEHLDAWFAACRAADLPMRLQLQAPFEPDFDPERVARRIAEAGVAMVNVSLANAFIEKPPCRDLEHSRRTVQQMNALTAALAARGVEANLMDLPFCHVAPENLSHAANEQQFFLDHQQYHRLSFELAVKAFRCSPNALGKAVRIPLGRNSSHTWYIDNRLLPWLLDGPRKHFYLLVWRKLMRPLRIIRGMTKPMPDTLEGYDREIARIRERNDKRLGPACSPCRFLRLCDHETQAFTRTLPGLAVETQPGDPVVGPMHFAVAQPKGYDVIDAARVGFTERYLALAKEAIDIVTNTTPTREVDSFDYEIEGQFTHQMPGGNRWHSFSNSEKLSTVLTRAVPPLTLAVTFGGGIADYIGFSFGRHSKLLCPMETYSHQLVLHINAEGRYVFLRDGNPVRPVEFEGTEVVPVRLSGVLEPRISICNIDGAIVTQTVLLWEGNKAETAALSRVKYSVVIVSTRYSRRLQSVLLCLAHQQNIDFSQLEVVIGYVPGIDATDDIIESLSLTHPHLRIVRAPFTESYAKSKGFLINESFHVASGEWIVLLDSDILLAPDTFAKMNEVADTCSFIASDGRTMLTPEITAKILLGEIHPWRDWDELLRSGGEFRLREANGVPIGFFQAVRKACMEKVKYQELDHFEGADWWFGHDMRQVFGRETRLSGVPVLHLDHGGSQWYGARKQR